MKHTEFLRNLVSGRYAPLLRALHGSGRSRETVAIPRRQLGHTGETVSMIGVGGWHMGSMPRERAAIRPIQCRCSCPVSRWTTHAPCPMYSD